MRKNLWATSVGGREEGKREREAPRSGASLRGQVYRKGMVFTPWCGFFSP